MFWWPTGKEKKSEEIFTFGVTLGYIKLVISTPASK